MSKLSTAQKIYTATVVMILVAWLSLLIGVPIYKYVHGDSELAALLEHLTAVLQYGLFGVVVLGWLLQRIGVLPVVQTDPALNQLASPVARLRNLAIWIVIALVLVFLFNLMQGTKPGQGAVDGRTIDLLTDYFPMVLIAGVWIYFVVQFQKKKKKDLEGGNSL